MSVDTAVDGDPGSCRRTAGRLHELHGELAEARAYLRGQAHLDPARFEGLSGDAYRGRCAAIGRTVDTAAESCRGLGRALSEYADGLDDVLAVMVGARDVARRELVLHGHTIPTPGGYATDRQRHVYRTVAASVAGARRKEARLRDDWLSAIARYAIGPVEDLCLPLLGLPPEPPGVVPGAVVSRPVAGAPRISTVAGAVVSRLVAGAPRTSTTGITSTTVPDSVWVPWGGSHDA
ncbi:MAG TPA: hypothetical protein VNQ53_03605 [Nocardioides sp.]|nr:hypothetical protein [Nocardioides sp.]